MEALNQEQVRREIRVRLIDMDSVYTTERVIKALSLLVGTRHREKRIENIKLGIAHRVPKTRFRTPVEELNELVEIGRSGEEGLKQLTKLLKIAEDVNKQFSVSVEETYERRLTRVAYAVRDYRRRMKLYFAIDYLKTGVRRSQEEYKKMFSKQSTEWRHQFDEEFLISDETDRNKLMREFYKRIEDDMAAEYEKLLAEYKEKKKA